MCNKQLDREAQLYYAMLEVNEDDLENVDTSRAKSVKKIVTIADK